jgi:hypothetical protein
MEDGDHLEKRQIVDALVTIRLQSFPATALRQRSDNHLLDAHMMQGHATKRANLGALQLVVW